MKRSNVLFKAPLVLILALSLNGCTLFSQDCSRPEVFCVGLVTDTGGLHDSGLTESAWNAMQASLSDGLIQNAAYIESMDARDYGKNIDAFARQGYDVIVTAGVGLEDDTRQYADRYAGSVFVALDQAPGDSPPARLLTVTFPEEQAGFLAGALAALATQTGVVGAVCETSGIGSNWRYCEGFRAGVRYEDPDVRALVVYRDEGSQEDLFRDEAWGRSSALDLIGRGADVIFGVGGGTGEAALAAAAEAGASAIGSEQDQSQVTREAQPALITSVVKDAGPALRDLLGLLKEGSLPAPVQTGAFVLSPFRGAFPSLSDQDRAAIVELKTQLEQQTVHTGVPAQAPK